MCRIGAVEWIAWAFICEGWQDAGVSSVFGSADIGKRSKRLRASFPQSLAVFRKRLGVEGFKEIFASRPIQSQTPQAMQAAADLANQLLFDAANLGSGDKTVSVVDQDARCAKHGRFCDGYMLDVMSDAESKLATVHGRRP